MPDSNSFLSLLPKIDTLEISVDTPIDILSQRWDDWDYIGIVASVYRGRILRTLYCLYANEESKYKMFLSKKGVLPKEADGLIAIADAADCLIEDGLEQNDLRWFDEDGLLMIHQNPAELRKQIVALATDSDRPLGHSEIKKLSDKHKVAESEILPEDVRIAVSNDTLLPTAVVRVHDTLTDIIEDADEETTKMALDYVTSSLEGDNLTKEKVKEAAKSANSIKKLLTNFEDIESLLGNPDLNEVFREASNRDAVESISELFQAVNAVRKMSIQLRAKLVNVNNIVDRVYVDTQGSDRNIRDLLECLSGFVDQVGNHEIQVKLPYNDKELFITTQLLDIKPVSKELIEETGGDDAEF